MPSAGLSHFPRYMRPRYKPKAKPTPLRVQAIWIATLEGASYPNAKADLEHAYAVMGRMLAEKVGADA